MSPERKLIFFSFSWEFRFDKLLRGPLIVFLNVEAVNRTNVAVLLDFLTVLGKIIRTNSTQSLRNLNHLVKVKEIP